MMKMWNTHTMPIMLALVMAFIDHLVTIGAFFCHPRFVSKQQSHQKAARCRLSRIQQQQHSITKSTMYASSIQHGSAHDSHCGVSNTPNRRKFVTDWSATIMTTILVPQYAMAAELGRTSNKALRKTGIADGNLSELPPEVRKERNF